MLCGKLPKTSLILKLLQVKHTYEVLTEWTTKKKMHFVDVGSMK